MVIYVNPILQDCKQALILLALISVFLFFPLLLLWAGKKFCSALLRTTVEVEFVVSLLGASQVGDFCTLFCFLLLYFIPLLFLVNRHVFL
jgi:hypothetical protein